MYSKHKNNNQAVNEGLTHKVFYVMSQNDMFSISSNYQYLLIIDIETAMENSLSHLITCVTM